MRILLVLVLACLAVSGCFSPMSSPTSSMSTAAATTSASVTKAPAPILPTTTDTLHFIAVPDLTTAKPTSTQDVMTPIPAYSDPSGIPGSLTGQRSPYLIWTVTLPIDLAAFKANATLWVDVEGTVLGDPFPTAGNCFWNVIVQTHQEPGLAGQTTTTPTKITDGCAVEPLQVPGGIRAIQIQFNAAQAALAKDAKIDLAFDTNAEQSPGATVTMLTGSVAHDSQITIEGLQMPLSTSLLASTVGAS